MKAMKSHCLQAFPCMVAPKLIKMNNGPAYISKGFQLFYDSYNILHKTGIPYDPQRQAIVEQAHQTLKDDIHKTKKGDIVLPEISLYPF